MAIHTIRLREPWERRTSVPGRLDLCRRFASPTGLGQSERVHVAAECSGKYVLVLLNNQELGSMASPGQHRWDITQLLRPRNEICLRFDRCSQDDAEAGREVLVRLEIE